MVPNPLSLNNLSEFLSYLSSNACADQERLPSLAELGTKLNVSVASLREQLEVARALGLVEVRPRIGIRRMPYRFNPAVTQSLAFAIALDPSYFNSFSDLRSHVESAYWQQAVSLLTSEDLTRLQELINQAWAKLNGTPIQIPHPEHRELHLTIYRRLGNPFVNGILEAYWDAYQAIGLDVYTDVQYLRQVWTYHQDMIDSITQGNYDVGFRTMMKHIDLLQSRNKSVTKMIFE